MTVSAPATYWFKPYVAEADDPHVLELRQHGANTGVRCRCGESMGDIAPTMGPIPVIQWFRGHTGADKARYQCVTCFRSFRYRSIAFWDCGATCEQCAGDD